MTARPFRFWWLSLVVIIVGMLLFSLCLVFFTDRMQQLFNLLFFSTSQAHTTFSTQASAYINFVYGVLGAVLAGWCVLLLFVLIGPFRRRERAAWWAVAASLAIWFVLDCVFSFVSGFWQNAVFDIVFMVLAAIPLAATYRHVNLPS